MMTNNENNTVKNLH